MNKEEFKALYSKWKEYEEISNLENMNFIISLFDNWLFRLLFYRKIYNYYKIRQEGSDKILPTELERSKLLEYLKQENP